MAGKPAELEQEWSVHAQLTFSHGGPSLDTTTPRVAAPHPCYGFQRGNITFTTKPPNDTASRRTPQPYGRRCMSTYNITLDPPLLAPRCHHTVTLSCQQPEDCDVCAGGRHSPSVARRAHTFTSHFCTRVPDKTVGTKSVASQTSRIFNPPAPSCDKLAVPSGSESDKRSASKSPQRLSRSPARVKGKSPLIRKPSNEAKKKPPRTVHIDVYCTGSDASCSSEAEEPSDSSRQTVFESEQVKVVHTREDDRLPQGLCRQKRQTLSESSTSHSCLGGLEPGDSTISSLYPSQRSSFASGVSLQDSLQTDSSMVSQVTSSCALFSDDLITSWKDTDVESVRQSDVYVTRNESFEYENSLDRLRIMQKEKAWNNDKNWPSAQTERKHHAQQKRYQQYIERRSSPFPQWQNLNENNEDDSEEDSSSDMSDDSASSEMAWSFGNISDRMKHVKREDTVRRASREAMVIKSESQLKKQANKMLDSGSLSDSAAPSPTQKKRTPYVTRDSVGPFGNKEPSPPKLKLESTATKPFTSTPGTKTDHFSKAEKFGTIMGSLRKPGHHVGPSKNPDCTCFNCRQYYEEMGYRTRTRSLGDMPSSQEREKWRATLDGMMQSKLTEDSGSGEWDTGTPV